MRLRGGTPDANADYYCNHDRIKLKLKGPSPVHDTALSLPS